MKAGFFMVLWEVERRDCVCWYITFLFCSLHHTFDVAFPAAFAFLRIMRCLVLPYVLGKFWKICLNNILCSVLYSITILTVINYSINFVGKGPWRYQVFFPTSLLSCLALQVRLQLGFQFLMFLFWEQGPQKKHLSFRCSLEQSQFFLSKLRL